METPFFREATRKNRGKCSLGPNGELIGYEGAGTPFPDVTPDDPDCGTKVAWNFCYRHEGDTQYNTYDYWLTDAKGHVKTLGGHWKQMRFANRTDTLPRPELPNNSDGIYRKAVIFMSKPFASKGMSQLTVAYKDSTRYNDIYVYVPGLRRTTRIGAGNRCDCMGGFVFNMDDNHGFDGNYLLFTWTFLKETELFVPMILDKPAKHIMGAHCLQIGFEKRKLWLIEQKSKDPSYCYGHKYMWFDPTIWYAYWGEMYDRQGNLWKNWSEYVEAVDNPPSAGGGKIMITNSGETYDYKIGESGPYNSYGNVVNSTTDVKRDMFNLDYLRRLGR
jgi:hypothetical protein